VTQSAITYEDTLNSVSTYSKPSDLRITDMRISTVVGTPMRCPIIKISTNQGIEGYGEVRGGASKRYALMIKSRILGENPCRIDKLFRRIKQFGTHGRQAGGVCGIEVPDGPGLGIESLNDEVIQAHLSPDEPELWASTEMGDEDFSHDRLWS